MKTRIFKGDRRGGDDMNIWVSADGKLKEARSPYRLDEPLHDVTDGGWHHIVISQGWNGTNRRYYYDGYDWSRWQDRLKYWLIYTWKVLMGSKRIQ